MAEPIRLTKDTPSVQYLCRQCKRLAKVIDLVSPITYTPHDENPYSFMVHEIIEQMLSVKAGAKIYSRLEELCDGQVTPARINRLSDEQIRNTGTSKLKVGYIRSLTMAADNGILDLNHMTSMTDSEIIDELTNIRGVGNWTAKMFLLFVLDRPDVLPFEDTAFLQVYRWMYKTKDCHPKKVTAKCSKWKPYSSIASRFCYRALDSGLTKEDFNLL